MRKLTLLTILLATIGFQKEASAQINEDQIGAWYMYFFSADLKDKGFGVQGDVQYRNW
ncbi:MAG: hypothetical protein ACJAUH_000487, partial [Saprospiraceae bacterium]